MDFTLRVQPDELKRMAMEFSAMADNIQRHFEQIEETVSQTRGYWIGEAGDQNRTRYDSYGENISYVVGRLKQHPVTLMQIFNIYVPAEQENVGLAASLPTDDLV